MGRAEDLADVDILLSMLGQHVRESREKDARFAEGAYEALGILEHRMRVLTRCVEDENFCGGDVQKDAIALCTATLRFILKDF